jgi:hypothetical protein
MRRQVRVFSFAVQSPRDEALEQKGNPMSAAQVTSTVVALNALAEMPMVKAVGALAGVYLVYLLGLRAYFKQKRAEQTRTRLLDSGIDLIAQQLDYALGIHRNNWALMLRYLKLYRDAPIAINVDDFFTQFRELDQGQFQIAPIHRLHALIDDEIIWNGYQKIFSFVATRNDRMKSDIGVALQQLASHDAHPKKERFVTEALVVAEEMSKDSDALYPFVSELMNLARIVDGSKLTRRQIERFPRREDVRNTLELLHKRYPEWLEKRPREKLQG